jgi:hypothetical protein
MLGIGTTTRQAAIGLATSFGVLEDTRGPMRTTAARGRLVGLVSVIWLTGFGAASARATDITLSFGSLPSAQGWTYGTGGSPLATEAGTWSVGAGVLSLDTMAFGTTGAGTSSYYFQSGVVDPGQPLTIEVRARLLDWEGAAGNQFRGNAFCFGFTQGATQYLMGITPTEIRNVNGTVLSSAYDNTQFHVYRLSWTPPSSVAYHVDATLISTNNAGFAQALNRILIGDVTGAGNARAEITSYSFLQGVVVPVQEATWSGIKAIYH